MKNFILICSLAAVSIMCVGLFLFDYIPNGLTVSPANHYETSSDTLGFLSGAEEAKQLLTQQNEQTSSQSGTTPSVQTNIIYDRYEITKSDLNVYKNSGILQTGRADPFAEVKQEDSDPGETTTPSIPNDRLFLWFWF